jgi:hypothetical protein
MAYSLGFWRVLLDSRPCSVSILRFVLQSGIFFLFLAEVGPQSSSLSRSMRSLAARTVLHFPVLPVFPVV